MFRFTVIALLLAVSNAFMAPALHAQRSSIVMQEQPRPKAPKAGWTLSMAGGVRTMEDMRKDQAKAKKAYEKSTMGGDGESDMKRYETGWTTK